MAANTIAAKFEVSYIIIPSLSDCAGSHHSYCFVGLLSSKDSRGPSSSFTPSMTDHQPEPQSACQRHLPANFHDVIILENPNEIPNEWQPWKGSVSDVDTRG